MTASQSEPEWDAEQRAWMQGLRLVEEGECPRCHTDYAETLGDENEKGWDTEHQFCHKCRRIAMHAESLREAKEPYANLALISARRRVSTPRTSRPHP